MPGVGDKILLSWSSGKDSAWALRVLRQGGANVVGLLSTFNEVFGRVSMHATRREIVEAQAQSVNLPLWPVMLPWPCSNDQYDRRMADAMRRATESGITHVAFGDLFLQDIRKYREERLASVGLQSLFPLWMSPDRTLSLARDMLRKGLRARVSCVDPKHLAASFVGREYDEKFLKDLPSNVDPCGENGEFHTICCAGPMFAHPIALVPGEIVERDGFWFADFLLREAPGLKPHV